jgi:peptide/nickel transport system permease protein
VNLSRYLLRKVAWYLAALVVAVCANFLLPRLVPGDPVDAMMANLGRGGGAQSEQMRAIREQYVQTFGLNQPLLTQFWLYLKHLTTGDLGFSFALYPAPVRTLIGQALPWSLALQVPAILVGWLVGNVLGALAAYRSGWLDRGVFLGSLVASSMPYYALAVLLLYLLAVAAPVLPTGGAYSFGNTPELSLNFVGDVLAHYWLPFLSLVIVFIGIQAVGMRSIALYESGAEYVTFARGLGLRDRTIIRYVFRRAMLPQVTGLALSIGTVVGGALLTEIVFSYPGLGMLLFNAISQSDYPVVASITLILTVLVLLANFGVEIAYGVIDPRIQAARRGER